MPFDHTEHFNQDGVPLAFRRTAGEDGRAGIVWLGGFHSDMLGEKASALHAHAREARRAFVRFDYFGHGESGGKFEDGTVGRWRSDALAVIDQLTAGPVVLVGSSMGGWMALLAALARPERVKALVLLAPAPDFTERLMWAGFSDDQKRQIMEQGFWTRPSPYDPAGYPIRRELIEEGRRWLIMDREIPIELPVRILQGGLDEDVPWTYSMELADKLRSQDVTWTFVKDGDHRLSRPQDIERMVSLVLATADGVDQA
ncbi:MAG TPA: alpha/beta hydrolase [Hyphomonadaceae bacterium]|nr:alpha/beta hydrolase [Hyphomonadaceae bacterium]